MLILLLIITLKNVLKQKQSQPKLKQTKLMLPLLLLIGLTGFAQSEKYFTVLKNNSEIGYIQMEQTHLDSRTIYQVQSKIATRFIFTYHISGNEKFIFDHGRLTYSYLKRVCNNKTKVLKELKWLGKEYMLTDKQKTTTVILNPIQHNLVKLFFMEPTEITEVYCDNYQAMASVLPMKEHSYKVIFPDGNFNIYYYRDRQLEKVEVFHTLYKVELLARRQKSSVAHLSEVSKPRFLP